MCMRVNGTKLYLGADLVANGLKRIQFSGLNSFHNSFMNSGGHCTDILSGSF